MQLIKCDICPHMCGVNREKGYKGKCKCNDKIKIALASVHEFEEPCISKINGSGTIFFSNCNLNCIYCQNYEISAMGKGKEVSIEELAEIMLRQQAKKVNNINLVTPTMYAYQIKEAIKIARQKGLSIPIVYNTNGYENVDTIKELKGYVDIYLPDLKYYSDEIAKKYSGIDKYFSVTTKAIIEMYKQVGDVVLDENGIIKKGVIIRHMILPNHMQNTKNILKWIKENIDSGVYVSVMAQYFPTFKAKEDELINRKISRKEYKEIERYLYLLGMENGYIQEMGEEEEGYVPDFNLTF